MAAGSLLVALGVLEMTMRAVLPTAVVKDLPHVLLSEDTQARVRWLERRERGQLDRYGFDTPDPLRGWRVRPNLNVRVTKEGSYDTIVRTNDVGLRGAERFLVDRTPGVPRIAIFGCSQTFGEGVGDGETYPAQLQSMLPGTEVLNFGVHGYGTDQMLLHYELDGRRYHPDVVVLAFAWFHMRRNVSRFSFFAKPRFDLDDAGLLRLAEMPVPDPDTVAATPAQAYTWPLLDRSVLLRWSWERVRNWMERDVYRLDGSAWKLSRALMERFIEEARQEGSRVVIMNIDENYPELDTALATLAKQTGAVFVNQTSQLRRLDEAKVQYRIPGDGHWNVVGHREVANQLNRALCAPGDRSPCLWERSSTND